MKMMDVENKKEEIDKEVVTWIVLPKMPGSEKCTLVTSYQCFYS